MTTTSKSTVQISLTVLPPPPTSPASSLALPITPFTGQALLTGTCLIPQFTIIQQSDGSFWELPMIGCADNRPACCPSLSLPPQTTSTTTVLQLVTESTEVVAALSAAPLNECPADYQQIGTACCPECAPLAVPIPSITNQTAVASAYTRPLCLVKPPATPRSLPPSPFPRM